MNAETGNEPESPKKRGRIPQSAWPQILERYRAGATLSAIAREFECTPSAISYILRKAEAASAGESPASAETPAAEAATNDIADEGTETAATEPSTPATAPERPAARRPRATLTAPASASQQQTAPQQAAPQQSATEQTAAEQTAPTASGGETLRLNRPEPQRAAEAPAPQPAPAAAPADAARNAAGRAEPTPPVDALEGRLRDTARGCLNAYRGWRQQPGEGSIQTLADAVHELRKALARIEIDMSASRRDEQAIRPIPIPAHRTSRRTQ